MLSEHKVVGHTDTVLHLPPIYDVSVHYAPTTHIYDISVQYAATTHIYDISVQYSPHL